MDKSRAFRSKPSVNPLSSTYNNYYHYFIGADAHRAPHVRKDKESKRQDPLGVSLGDLAPKTLE
jgi:hypothetical protein